MDFTTLQNVSPVYPMYIKQYKDTLLDPNSDVQTKMNSVVQSLNQLSQNENDLVNNWNKVMQWAMNDGLDAAVSTQMTALENSGYFNSLLTSLFNSELGTETLDTSSQDIKGAINEVKGIADSNTSALAEIASLHVSIDQYGAKANDPTFDNLPIINNAIADVASKGGGSVTIPEKTYYIKPTATSNIVLQSYVDLVGKSWGSVLKVMPTTGNYPLCIGQIDDGITKSRLYNVHVKNFTLDQNPTGNTNCDIKNGVGLNGTANRQHGIEFRNQENCHVENMNIIGCGMNTIKMVGTTYRSKYGSIKNCRVTFQRGSTTVSNYDNSVVYFSSYGHEISGNVFTTNDPSQGFGGIEVHGAFAKCFNNVIENFQNAMHIVGDHLDYPVNCIVEKNQFINCFNGIWLWDTTTGKGLDGVSIKNNKMLLTTWNTLTYDSTATEMAGVKIVTGTITNPYNNINISNNEIIFDPNQDTTVALNTAQVGGILLATYTANQHDMTNIKINNNIILNSPSRGIGIVHATDATYKIENMEISNNIIVNPVFNNNTTAIDRTCGITLRGTVKNGLITGNIIRDTRTTSKIQNAFYLSIFGTGTYGLKWFNNSYADVNGANLPNTLNSSYVKPLDRITGTANIVGSTTSIVVTHGLGYTPTNVICTSQGDVGNTWVTSIGTTQFTINCKTAPASNTVVSWVAS